MNPYLLVYIKQEYRPTTPNDWNSTLFLMRKLSHRSQVICALEAAKMAFPIWERYVPKDKKLTKEQIEYPKKAIGIIERWLIGKATEDEVAGNYYVDATYSIQESKPLKAAFYALESIENGDYSYSIVNAVESAYYSSDSASSFYLEWWSKCYPLIGNELQNKLQNKYDILCNQIIEDI